MSRVTCLIDTNILIHFEEADESGVIKKEIAEVFSLCLKHGVSLIHHPVTVSDINRDKNISRRRETLSKQIKYPELEHPPIATIDELERLFGGINNDNDHVDCQLLYALYRNCADFLITEDTGIHRRGARKSNSLRERIFSLRELESWILRNFEPNKIELPQVQDVPVHALNKDETFFDSLRAVYTNKDGFNVWFEKCCKEGRRAWAIFNDDNTIAGLCIYNLDSEYKESLRDLGNNPLKLCTFKVAEDARGYKYGELLLKTSLLYAKENNITSLWLTAFGSQQVHLIHFLKDFGFVIANCKY